MANRWGNETVRDFIFWVSKITADSDYNQEIKRHLLLGRKAMTSLDSILESRGIVLQTKVHLVLWKKLWFFQWSCMDVSWAIKKAEHRRIDAFKLWC